MLAMSPNLMGGMSDAHLISALEAEGPLTPAEIELSNLLNDQEVLDLAALSDLLR